MIISSGCGDCKVTKLRKKAIIFKSTMYACTSMTFGFTECSWLVFSKNKPTQAPVLHSLSQIQAVNDKNSIDFSILGA